MAPADLFVPQGTRVLVFELSFSGKKRVAISCIFIFFIEDVSRHDKISTKYRHFIKDVSSSFHVEASSRKSLFCNIHLFISTVRMNITCKVTNLAPQMSHIRLCLWIWKPFTNLSNHAVWHYFPCTNVTATQISFPSCPN